MKHIIALSFLFGAAVAAAGGIDPTEFDCPHDTARYQKLIQDCAASFVKIKRWSESSAPLAKDMRNVIKQMVRDDAPNAEIIGFMTARYGVILFCIVRRWPATPLFCGGAFYCCRLSVGLFTRLYSPPP